MTPGLVVLGMARFESIRSSITTKILRRLSSRAGSPIRGALQKLPHPHRLYFYFQSCTSSKLHILRTMAAIAISGPSHLRRKEKINGRDYDGCVCPQGIDSDGKVSRADCPTTPFVSFPLDPTVTPCSGAAAGGGKALKADYRLSLPLSDRKQHHV
jgi:hypothetical protein